MSLGDTRSAPTQNGATRLFSTPGVAIFRSAEGGEEPHKALI